MDYEEVRSTVISLLTAANEDDLSLFYKMKYELSQSPEDQGAVLFATMFFALGLLDRIEELTGTTTQKYIQWCALTERETT